METKRFLTVIRNDDFIVRDHRVHGVRVMPGVTFIDVVYRILQGVGAELERIALRNILFSEPVATSEDFDRQLRVTLAHNGNASTILAESRRFKDGTSPDGDTWVENFRCEWSSDGVFEESRIRIRELIERAKSRQDIESVYERARTLGIRHYEFMKGLGTIHWGDGELLAEIGLGSLASEYADNFCLHPVFLDCSTLFPFCFDMMGGGDEQPYIPIFISAFSAGRRLAESAYVYVRKRERSGEGADILRTDYEIYDREGRSVARFEGFAAKRIRSKDLIERLVDGSASARALPTPKTAPRAAGVLTGAPQREPILEGLRRIVAESVGKQPDEISAELDFYEQGIESADLIEIVRKLERSLGCQLYPTLLFEYTNVTALADYLAQENAELSFSSETPSAVAPSTVVADVPPEGASLLLIELDEVAAPGPIQPSAGLSGRTLVADFSSSLGEALAASPGFEGGEVIVAARRGGDRSVDFGDRASVDALVRGLMSEGKVPDRILVLLSESSSESPGAAIEAFFGILWLYRAWLASFAKREVSVLVAYAGGDAGCFGRALVPLLRTLSLENPHWKARTIELDFTGDSSRLDAVSRLLADELSANGDVGADLVLGSARRSVRGFREVSTGLASAQPPAWKREGVYIVAGGGGYLGKLVAERIARASGAAVLAIGRSAAPKHRSNTPQIEYVACDLADPEAAHRVVADAKRRHGKVNGVVYAAGILRDGLAHTKARADAEAVFRAKIEGALALDEALAAEALDFFVLFSSTTGLFGNVGQCDYAFANAALDSFASLRAERVRRGTRFGKTLSLSWPLWNQGGMGADPVAVRRAAELYGVVPLSETVGLDCFERALTSTATRLGVLYGDADKLRRAFGIRGIPAATSEPTHVVARSEASQQARPNSEGGALDIAIVGISGRFPQASDLEEFWHNLRSGRDCISEIPPNRWNHAAIYDAERGKIGHSYSKWGGFIEGVEQFDPLFFNISPREAEMLDPQERIFLETAWQVVEDGGYTRKKLANETVGVFVGVMWGQYQLFERAVGEASITPASFYAAVPNRVSYFFDFKGPSIAVDTMCSSSLTSVYLACQAIRNGDCTMALAGGVNLSLHPNKYVQLSQAQFFSSDGRCRAFGAGGDGYVPGEGSGAVLLKPLEKARADGDRIYAVIRAGAFNHGGKTSGFSVPHPVSQARAISTALDRSGWEPSSISYIEAHGTGTSLGDPIEVSGLVRALEKNGKLPARSVAIGSVKSNIGHLEAAAGIAALAKVVLQMQHAELVPSLHSEELNPGIPFTDTPLFVPQAAVPWQTAGERRPLRAGISAFGAGGSNAHLLLESYESQASSAERRGPNVFLLSARDEDRLLEAARRMLAFLGDSSRGLPSLTSMCFTSQFGREAFEERLAIVIDSVDDLGAALRAFSEGRSLDDILFRGSRAPGAARPPLVLAERSRAELLEAARTWSAGGQVEWAGLYASSPALCSLPSYPFYRERCWVREDGWMQEAHASAVRGAAIHPLLDLNTSDVFAQSFVKQLGPADAIIAEHEVMGRRIFPGAAYIEMARAAALASRLAPPFNFEDVTWLSPAVLSETGLSLSVRLEPSNGALAFRISSGEHESDSAHCTGKLSTGVDVPAATRVSIERLKANISDTVMAGAAVYESLTTVGFNYGPSYRVTQELRCSPKEALSHLHLAPEHAGNTQLEIHPSLLDGAFRATMGISETWSDGKRRLRVPFAIEKLTFLRAVGDECYAHARLVDAGSSSDSGALKFDIDMLDASGEELVRIRGFSVRPLEKDTAASRIASESELHYFEQRSIPRPLAEIGALPSSILALVPSRPELLQALDALRGRGVRVFTATLGASFQSLGSDAWQVSTRSEDLDALLRALPPSALASFGVLALWSLQTRTPPDAEVNGLDTSLLALRGLLAALAKTAPQAPARCLFVYPEQSDGATLALHRSVRGFAKSISVVCPRVRVTGLELDAAALVPPALGEALLREMGREPRAGGEWFSVRVGQRSALEVVALDDSDTERDREPVELRRGGVYLIVGGAGGLGTWLANKLSREYAAKLVLVGRSAPNETIAAKLAEIGSLGGSAIYRSCDIGNALEVRGLVSEVFTKYGALHGIVHCAGHADTRPFNQVSAQEFAAALAPKVQGTLHLDAASADIPLDFFLLFSSISSAMGDFGVGSYAASNAFLDSFARSREAARRLGQRRGRSLSIAWPYWSGGGMAMGAEAEALYFGYSGLKMLDDASGWAALRHVLGRPRDLTVVVPGDLERIQRSLGIGEARAQSDVEATTLVDTVSPGEVATSNNDELEERLKEVFSRHLKIPKTKIGANDSFDRFGLDSVLVMEITKALEDQFGALPKTLLFEVRTLHAVSNYLVTHGKWSPSPRILSASVPAAPSARANGQVARKLRFQTTSESAPPRSEAEPIAIIGVAGRYPDSESLEEFWQGLRAGKDFVIEIPAERWDHRAVFDARPGVPMKTYSKWGSFLDRPGAFDAAFFNIPPVLASTMNPQERLFLQTAWAALEDAGYTREAIREERDGESIARLGVFVGVMWNDYLLYGGSSDHSSIANRVSYVLNASGPSVAFDTACSSSLVAIHYACEHLRSNDCRYAIAGGVNLSMHASKYIGLSSIRALSPTGRCRAFGSGADGYVPGEGVGAVLLKRLSDALRDNDHIYGVILGSALNHGGRTHGFTVPNPAAQARVITEALQKSRVHARTLGYIEAHGTGTSLGDPIEVSGVKAALERHTQDKGFCRIGSLKSNLGHLEAAAGVASLTKVLFQLRDSELAPSIHADELNPLIDFADSPVRLQRELEPWTHSGELPRRAGISAFGAGGTNVHLVVEEHRTTDVAEDSAPSPELFVLSAANPTRLRAYGKRIAEHLASLRERNQRAHRVLTLRDIAHTYQVGREHMAARLALVARDVDDLEQRLRAFSQGEEVPGLATGELRDESAHHVLTSADPDDLSYLKSLVVKRGWEKLGRIWVDGADIDWRRVRSEESGRRVSMPSYPFDTSEYWLEPTSAAVSPSAQRGVHPLLDANESTLARQRYSKQFSGTEFYLADHVVGSKRILPGAACIEMALAAANHATDGRSTGLAGVFWAEPIVVGDAGAQVFVDLAPEGEGLSFEIWTGTEGAAKVHARGQVAFDTSEQRPPPLDLGAIERRCENQIGGVDVYGPLAAAGLEYGPSFRVIETLRCGPREALAALRLGGDRAPADAEGGFSLHPSLLDGAFQAASGILSALAERKEGPYVPVSIESITLYAIPQSPCVAYVALEARETQVDGLISYDVYLADLAGNVCALVRRLSARAFKLASSATAETRDGYFTLAWETAELPDAKRAARAMTLVYDTSGGQAAERLRDALGSGAKVVSVVDGADLVELSRDAFRAPFALAERHQELFAKLGVSGGAPLDIVYVDSHDAALPSGFLLALTRALRQHGAGRVRLLLALCGDHSETRGSALWGFANSASAAIPGLQVQILSIEQSDAEWQKAALHIARELGDERSAQGVWASYLDGIRRTRRVVTMPAPKQNISLREGGVYVISGGAGGLGALVARHLAGRYGCRLLLTGRSQSSPKIESLLAELRALGGSAEYQRADAGDRVEMQRALEFARERFGAIHGVFHSAGVASGTPVTHADVSAFNDVLNPKIAGTLLLDELTADDRLDFLVLFSSCSAMLGDFGSCSYAMGNAFQNAFAAQRDEWVRQGIRYGKTISIAWPLWRDGGMSLPDEALVAYERSTGMSALESAHGIRILEDCLSTEVPACVVVAPGRSGQIRATFERIGCPKTAPRSAAPADVSKEERSPADSAGLYAQTIQYLKRRLAEATGMSAESLRSKAEFHEYGIDSIVIMDLNRKLADDFSDLPKTLFFEHKSLHELANYFIESHRARLGSLLGLAPKPASVPDVPVSSPANVTLSKRSWSGRALNGARTSAANVRVERSGDIAIIGVDGRYPQAPDLATFWDNIASGKDCISEIPIERWDYRINYEPGKRKIGRTYAKWGGFLEGIAEFDPLFFRISPREADWTDPQERLFLQTAWKTLEDAGYTREDLAKRAVGVFVGVMWANYQLLGANLAEEGRGIAPNCLYASIPNRVSYFFDFKGPSMAVDTMCSSSLLSIHLAAESIRSGECELALAGGVNLCLHPNKYLQLCQGNFLSSDGRCRAFGAGGDGYVPGEGVGAVLLKSLEQAILDGDHIYAVIKAGAVNHGGRTNGFSVPNPSAQAEVVSQALSKAGMDAGTISYVEAHGTGTALGDPIEVSGLERAFSSAPAAVGECALGTVKSNIGHLEAAAGIAGVTKVLLQFKHGQLAPSLHADSLNPSIPFENSRFRVQRRLQEWQRPRSSDRGELPRRAGVSAFGAGGTNVHLVLEEYRDNASSAADDARPHVIVLSAKDRERLMERASELVDFLSQAWQAGAQSTPESVRAELLDVAAQLLSLPRDQVSPFESLVGIGMDAMQASEFSRIVSERWGLAAELAISAESTLESLCFALLAQRPLGVDETREPRLGDVAYTLQVGREAMPCRIAFVAATKHELLERLRAIVAAGLEQLPAPLKADAQIDDDDGLASLLDACAAAGNLAPVVSAWTAGGKVEWRRLYRGRQPRRVSLPTYRFARERHWLPDLAALAAPAQTLPSRVEAPPRSEEIRSRRSVRSDEFFVRDHVVGGKRIMPGSGFLHLVCEAAESLARGPVCRISDVVWMNPLSFDGVEQRDIEVRFSDRGGEYSFAIALEGSAEPAFVQGKLAFERGPRPARGLDKAALAELKQRARNVSSGSQVYESLASIGFDYGESFRVTQAVFGLGRECLTELGAPRFDVGKHLLLHPCLFDAVLRAPIGIDRDGDAALAGIPVPFAIEELSIFRALDSACCVHAISAESGAHERRFDLRVYGGDGEITLEVKGFAVRMLPPNAAERATGDQLSLYAPGWKHRDLPADAAARNLPQRLMIWDQTPSLARSLRASLGAWRAGRQLVCVSDAFDTWLESDVSERLHSISDCDSLLAALAARDALPDAIVCRFARERSDEFASAQRLFDLYRALQTHAKERSITILALCSVADKTAPEPMDAALYGFANSVAVVNPKHTLVYAELESSLDEDRAAEYVARELLFGERRAGDAVRFGAEHRLVRVFERLPESPRASAQSALRSGGVYLITGGLGGVGRSVAEYLAHAYRPKIALCGRRGLDDDGRAFLARLEAVGAQASYHSCDLSNAEQVRQLVARIEEQHGALSGIFHAAGVKSERLVTEIAWSEFAARGEAKILGTHNLELACQGRNVDFLCLFSSVSSVFGDFGACSYAFANAYLDGYAQAARGTKSGGCRVVAIDWPYWESGGITLEDEAAELYFKFSGMRPLHAQAAFRALERALGEGDAAQVLVAYGDNRKIADRLGRIGVALERHPERARTTTPVDRNVPRAEPPRDKQGVIAAMKELLFALIGLPPEKVDERTPLVDYGMDSVSMMEFASGLNEIFGELPRTALFDHGNLDALASYVLSRASVAALKPTPVPSISELRPPAANGASEAAAYSLARSSASASRAKLESRSAGAGEQVVLIPGIGFTGAVWERQFRALSDEFRLTAVNLPGHGNSIASMSRGLDGICSDVVDAIEDLGIKGPYHLVATSLGGMVAMRIAAKHPDRLRSLTIATGFHELPPSFKIIKLEEMIRQELEVLRTGERREALSADAARGFSDLLKYSYGMNPEYVGHYGKIVATESNATLLPMIRVKTLVLAADCDTVVDSDCSDAIHRLIPGSEMRVIRNAGHFSYVSHATEFNQLLTNFMRESSSATDEARRICG